MHMAFIKRITTQKNNKDRYSVYIDNGNGEQFGFGVNEDVLIQFGLRKGLELDDELITQIAQEDEIKKALHLCYSFLSYRMRSEQEVVTYLKKKNIDESITSQVIEQLKEQQYMNDLEFAKSYVRDKKRLSSKGPLVILKELQKKGVSESESKQALQEFPEVEQLEAAKTFIMKKASLEKKESYKALRQKLGLQLQKKGFPYEIIEAALQHLPEKNSEDEREILRIHAEKAHRRYKKYTGFDYTRRMKQYLYSKGFSMELINEIIEEMQDDTEE